MNRWLSLIIVISGFSFSYCSNHNNDPAPMPVSSVAAPVTTVSTVTTTTSPVTTTTSAPPKDGYTYLALGDSYTYGQSVDEADRWPMQLAGMLKADGININPPDIIARTGWTTAELADAIAHNGNTKTYSMVSLLIGVNNQYRGQSIDMYRAELAGLLKTAIAFADAKPSHVFMLSIPDWGQTPFAPQSNSALISAEIDEFNVVASQECTKAGIQFIDVTKFTRNMVNPTVWLAKDGLHYSGLMYKLWAETVLPTAKEILKN